MIPLLIWFMVIVLIALLACLAIKFLTLRIILALILTLPILISIAFCVLRRSPVTESNKPLFFNSINIVSERGAHGTVHENTIAAFRQAKQNGADTIKMDVRMTKDGMLIVLRPDSVTTDNATFVVEETHWIQMSQINAYGGNNGTILTFDEAVSWCESNNMNMLWHIPDFSSDLLTYLRNKIMQDNLYSKVAVTTYCSLAILKMRCTDTQLLIGLVWKSTEHSIVNGTAVGNQYTSWYFSMMDTFTYWGVRSLLLPNFLGVDFLVTSVDDADRALIVESATSGIKTLIYDVETTQERNYFARQLQLPIVVDDLVALLGTSSSAASSNNTRRNSN
uniref:GP-PDE domain-containing protein n=2 Tax=Caenorhabditis tropicalis TaxID=1561998 RepID=A0A1I7U003_9PELO